MTVLVEAMSVQLSNCLSYGFVTAAAWDAILGLSTTLLTELSLALVVLPFHLSFSDDENASVMGLEVPPPPPLKTSENHGVFILSSSSSSSY